MSKELLKNSLNDLDFEHVINNLVEKATFYKSKEKASKLYPSFSQNEVKTLLKQTEEGRKLLEIEGNFNFRGISNIEESIKQAKLDGILSGKDLIQISNTLDTFTNLKTKISKHNQQFEHIGTLVTKISDLNYLSFSIKNQISQNGLVKDSASPTLSKLRNDVREAYERLTSALQNILKKPHVESAIQDNVISIRGDRLVLQVKSNLRSRVPGVVHDASNTGMTLFSGTSSRGTIAFGDGRSGNAQYRGVILYEHSNDSMRFATADTTQMNISSTGQITKPDQASFAAMKSGNAYVLNGEVFPFDTTTHNIGSHFNTSNHRFTAPVAGRYMFNFYLFVFLF